MVSGLSMAFILFSLVVSVAFPVGLYTYMKRRYGISFKVVGIGVLTFVVFSQVLEKYLHYYVLGINPQSVALINSPFLFATYAALAAGVFEEVGRYISFRYLLKKYRDWKDGVAFGIGHGGVEAVLIGFLINVQTYVFARMINSGTLEEGLSGQVDPETLSQIKDGLVNTSPWVFAAGGMERVFSLVLQIALSLVVLYSVRSGRVAYLLIAILVHALVDFPAGLYQAHYLNLWLVEAFVALVGVASVIYVIRSKQLFKSAD